MITSTGIGTEKIEQQEQQEQQLRKKKEQRKQRKIYLKNLNLCKKSLRKVTWANGFWFFCLLCLSSIYALLILDPFSWSILSLSEFKSHTPAVVGVGVIFFLLIICRFISNSGIHKQFSTERKSHLKAMPDHPTPTIRNLYIFYRVRRLHHYWLSFVFFWLGFLSIAYCVLIAGIYKVASSSSSIKLFETNTYTSMQFFSDLSTQIVSCSLIFIFLVIIQYCFISSKYKNTLAAIECVYGKEKLVNECLLDACIYKESKKYKIIVFVIVCFLGCVFYLFFKRLICTIFDKSFTF